MVWREVVFDESLVVEGEYRQVYSKKLFVARALEQDGSIFEILDELSVDCSTGVGMKISVCRECGKSQQKGAKSKNGN